jgi:type IX secretion system PorP/SprF family membrane protein
MSLRKSILVCFLAICGFAFAQQAPLYSSYSSSELAVNPAFSGIYDYIPIQFVYRNQWSGMTESPSTVYFSGHSAIDDNHGVGLVFQSDKYGLVDQNNAIANYAYRLPVSLDYNMSFGLGLKMGQLSFRNSEAQTHTGYDPVYNGQDQSTFNMDFNFGFAIFSDDLLAGISIDNLMQSDLELGSKDVRSNTIDRDYKLFAHYYYELENLYDFALEPAMLVHFNEAGRYQADVNINMVYQDFVYAGVMYRVQDAFGISAGFRGRKFTFGYVYEFGTSDLSDYHSGSHEFMLGINLEKTRSSQNNRWYDRHKTGEWSEGSGIFTR